MIVSGVQRACLLPSIIAAAIAGDEVQRRKAVLDPIRVRSVEGFELIV